MLRYLVPLLFILSSVTSRREWMSQYRPQYPKTQVASESQLKFALENKYDDTGPGAKQPEYAYHTYKNLEDALIAYLDDPDTKLPEHERVKAINKLTKSQYYASPEAGKLFYKNSHFNDFTKPQFRPLSHEAEVYNFPVNKIFFSEENKGTKTGPKGLDGNDVLNYQNDKKLETFKFQKIQSVKGSPLSLAHYTRDPDIKKSHDQFDPHPKYTFSYGVHDKTTGDSKTAHESRDGGTVRGFYSFIDADGKTRTVHYTADDRRGFRAEVQKTI